MGNRTSGIRKSNDITQIKTPISVLQGGGTPYYEDNTSINCKVSFDISITKSPFTISGLQVTLKESNGIYEMYISGEKIGRVTKKYSRMMKECAKQGFRYIGKISTKNEKYFVRFFRTSD